jgi:uncharacterized protein (DUF302 family)
MPGSRACLWALVALAHLAVAGPAAAAEPGVITKQSRYSVKDTIERFKAAVRAKEAAGFVFFAELDHAAAAKKVGLEMRPRTVLVFGNPKVGTPVMVKTPLIAIDVPPKALVWQGDDGKVWLSYNSADYLFGTIYPRHGLPANLDRAVFAKALEEISDYATK